MLGLLSGLPISKGYKETLGPITTPALQCHLMTIMMKHRGDTNLSRTVFTINYSS